MILNAHAVCHKGKIRQNNEDNLLFISEILDEIHDEMNIEFSIEGVEIDMPQLFGVFDGMGGYSKGAAASHISAEEAKKFDENLKKNHLNIAEQMRKNCLNVNERVCEIRREQAIRMGTTLAMLCMYRNECFMCNLGDSPIYRFRCGELTDLYEEHTERKLYEVVLGKERVIGKKFSLTQHIGIFKEEIQIEPFVCCDEVQVHDLFLICSDGLTDMVSKTDISKILNENATIGEKTKKLKEEALEAGGHDNITIICIEVT